MVQCSEGKAENNIQIKDLDESNVEDLIYVCSSKHLKDPIHNMGVAIKKKWLLRMLKEHGPVAKIAYYQGRPVGQVLYWPERLDPTRKSKGAGVIYLNCIYNPFPEAQRGGVGTRLLRALIEEAKTGSPAFGGRYRYIVTYAFDTKEFLSQPAFYAKMGFKQMPGSKAGYMYIRLSDHDAGVEKLAMHSFWEDGEEYAPLQEDKGKIIAFYSPACQFSYQFAFKAVELIRGVAPDLPAELVNSWEKPEEYLKRGRSWLIVNAKAIKASLFDKDSFLNEVREALKN